MLNESTKSIVQELLNIFPELFRGLTQSRWAQIPSGYHWVAIKCDSGFIWNSDLVQISCLFMYCMCVCMCGFVFSWHIRHCTYSMWTGEADRPQTFSGKTLRSKILTLCTKTDFSCLLELWLLRGWQPAALKAICNHGHWRPYWSVLPRIRWTCGTDLFCFWTNNWCLILQRGSSQDAFWKSPFSPSASHEGVIWEMMLMTKVMIDADDERQ